MLSEGLIVVEKSGGWYSGTWPRQRRHLVVAFFMQMYEVIPQTDEWLVLVSW